MLSKVNTLNIIRVGYNQTSELLIKREVRKEKGCAQQVKIKKYKNIFIIYFICLLFILFLLWWLSWYYNFYFALFRNTMSGNAKSNHRRFSVRRSVLINFAKFTGKHLCQSLFFNKVAGHPATLLKTRDSGTSIFLWVLRNF